MAETILLLGGNTGDPPTTLAQAMTMVAERVGKVLAQSRDHWTEPWGFQDERLFLNKAIIVGTDLSPERTMAELLDIEQALGRERSRKHRYASRSIDLDILFISDEVIDLPDLTVPHPRVHQRAFALGPAADVVPGLVHPLLGRTVLDLLNDVLQAR